ncbi:hypothetical protein HK405_000431 [Cladochytrium tenue]|nr:hypothetical protein HK405_000431 [Cladochytrium tenue]
MSSLAGLLRSSNGPLLARGGIASLALLAPRPAALPAARIAGLVRTPAHAHDCGCGGCCSAGVLPAPLQSAGYKTKTALKLMCPGCFFTRRGGRLRVICKDNKKHKQVQG